MVGQQFIVWVSDWEDRNYNYYPDSAPASITLLVRPNHSDLIMLYLVKRSQVSSANQLNKDPHLSSPFQLSAEVSQLKLVDNKTKFTIRVEDNFTPF